MVNNIFSKSVKKGDKNLRKELYGSEIKDWSQILFKYKDSLLNEISKKSKFAI